MHRKGAMMTEVQSKQLMFYTLGQLKEKVEREIEKKGEDSPVAAYIFTKDDVVSFDEDTMQEIQYSDEIVEQVLDNVGESDYLYEQALSLIDDEISFILKSQK